MEQQFLIQKHLQSYSESYNEWVAEERQKMIKSGELVDIALAKLEYLDEQCLAEQNNKPIWKRKFMYKDKGAIRALHQTIERIEKINTNFKIKIDNYFKEYTKANEKQKEWWLWLVDNLREEIIINEKIIKQCWFKIKVTNGQIEKEDNINLERAKSIPLSEILGSEGEGKGNRRFFSCPLHQEKTPSFIWFIDVNRFKCFGCGEWGDGVDLYSKLNNCSFIQAVKELNQF